MTLEETRQILATIASFDGRAVDRRVIEDWHATGVGAIPYPEALAAVRRWYTENRGYIQPSDLVATAIRLGGYDTPDSVTQRRLESRALPFADEPLGEPAEFEPTGGEHE